MRYSKRLLPRVIKYFIVGCIALLFVIVPLWVVLVNSFKPLREANLINIQLPEQWQLIENYTEVIRDGRLIRGFFNTTFLTIVSVSVMLIFGSMAAWYFARNKRKSTTLLYFISILAILIPPTIVTNIRLLKVLNIYGSYVGLICFYVGSFLSFCIFFTTGFIKNIPYQLEESARIDGANHFTVFFKIIFPLLKPILVTSSIFLVLFIWNDFIYPLYFLRDSSKWTLVLGLYNFVSKFYHHMSWNLIFADVLLVSLPLLIFYFIAQKKIIGGIMAGAVKG